MTKKVIYICEKLPQGYIGMNRLANKKFKALKGYPIPNYPRNTFYVYNGKGTDAPMVDRTIRHEEVEEHLLGKGWDYKKKRKVSAHDVANALEDDYNLKTDFVVVKGDGNKRGTVRRRME
jgi:hypothetical protein